MKPCSNSLTRTQQVVCGEYTHAMPSWIPLSRTAVWTSSVMSVTVRPPAVRSFVSSWKTLTGAILLDDGPREGENPLLSREPAPGAAGFLAAPGDAVSAVLPGDRERAVRADAARLGLQGRARDHVDPVRVEGAERRAVRGRAREVDRAEVRERQDTAPARRRLGDHLGRRERGRLQPLRRRERPVLRRVGDGE